MAAPKGVKNPRVSNVEVDLRVKAVTEMLLQGFTRTVVVQKYSKEWGVSDRTIDEYISKARDIIQEINTASLKQNQSLIVSNLWDVFREARQHKDRNSALMALREIARVQGLDQSKITHIIEDKRDLLDVPESELESILEYDIPENH